MDNEKLLEWLKRLYGVKERLIFGLVVCVLAFRVYQILVVPNTTSAPPPPPPPMDIPGTDPPPPPVQKPVPPITEWVDLYRKPTMFEEQTAQSKGEQGPTDRVQDFVLDSIQKSGGSPLAFIRSKKGGRKYFVRTGETFESDFTVVRIDADKMTVDVRNSETKKTVTLSVEEKKK